jgi:hypothetical protein
MPSRTTVRQPCRFPTPIVLGVYPDPVFEIARDAGAALGSLV